MDFQIRQIGQPNEGRAIVNENVADVSTRFSTRNGESLDPFGCEAGSILFVKEFTESAIGIALQSDRAVFQVWEQDFGQPGVEVNDIGFTDLTFGKEDLVQIR